MDAARLFTSHFDVKSYDVSFGINRLNFHIQHHALNLFKGSDLFHVLINNPRYSNSHSANSGQNIISTNTERADLNPEQNLAVRCIKSSDVSIPLLIFGPPGKFYIYSCRFRQHPVQFN